MFSTDDRVVLITYGDEDLDIARRFDLGAEEADAPGVVYRAQFRNGDTLLMELTSAAGGIVAQPVEAQAGFWDIYFFKPEAEMRELSFGNFYEWRLRIERPDGTIRDLITDGVWHHSRNIVRIA